MEETAQILFILSAASLSAAVSAFIAAAALFFYLKVPFLIRELSGLKEINESRSAGKASKAVGKSDAWRIRLKRKKTWKKKKKDRVLKEKKDDALKTQLLYDEKKQPETQALKKSEDPSKAKLSEPSGLLKEEPDRSENTQLLKNVLPAVEVSCHIPGKKRQSLVLELMIVHTDEEIQTE